MKNLFRTITASLLVATLLFACTEDYFEFDKIKTDEWRPELALPLINSTLNLSDIVIKNDTAGLIQTNSSGKLEVVYRSSVISTDGNRAYTVPIQTFLDTFKTPFQIPAMNGGVPIPPFVTNIDLEFKDTSGYGIVVDSMLLKQGQLAFTIENDYPYPINIEAKFRTFTDNNGDTLVLNYSIPAAVPGSNMADSVQVRAERVDLTGFQLNMTEDANGNPGENRIPIDLNIDVQLIDGIGTEPDQEIRLAGAISNIDFKEFYGFLGGAPLEIEKDTIFVDFFRSFQEFAREDLFISNPFLSVNVFNSFSIPVKFEFLFLDAINNKRNPAVVRFDLPDSLKPLIVNYPSKYGRAITNVQLDRNNSNIDEILSHLVEEIGFDSRVEFNPDGLPAPGEPRNFMSDTSDIGLDLEFRIPFEGRANGFFLEDTVDFNFETADELDNGLIRIITENSFPMKIDLQLVFLDSLGGAIDSLFQPGDGYYQNGFGQVISAAPVNQTTGESNGTERDQTDITLDGNRFQKLTDARKAVILARLSTTEAGQQQNIVFNPSNTLGISVGLKAAILID